MRMDKWKDKQVGEYERMNAVALHRSGECWVVIDVLTSDWIDGRKEWRIK